jgi:hypothetical protein
MSATYLTPEDRDKEARTHRNGESVRSIRYTSSPRPKAYVSTGVRVLGHIIVPLRKVARSCAPRVGRCL